MIEHWNQLRYLHLQRGINLYQDTACSRFNSMFIRPWWLFKWICGIHSTSIKPSFYHFSVNKLKYLFNVSINVEKINLYLYFQTVNICVLVSGLLFGVTAGLAAWKYAGSTTANILQIAPAGHVSRAAILLSALQLIFSSVIGHAALFLHLEDELRVRRSQLIFFFLINSLDTEIKYTADNFLDFCFS